MRAVLEVLQGGIPGQKIPLEEGGRVTVGRSADCTVQLLDKGVSRRHLAVSMENGEAHVEDLASANGTFLNGQKIRKARLSDGDLIRLGLGAIRVSLEGNLKAEKVPESTDDDSSSALGEIFATHIRRKVDPDKSVILQTDVPDVVLKRAHGNLTWLYKLANELQAATDLDSVSEEIVEMLQGALSADKTALVLVSHSGRPFLASAAGTAEGYLPPQDLIQEVLNTGTSLLVKDIEQDERVQQDTLDAGVSSLMCTPVSSSKEILGVLYAESVGNRMFDEVDMEFLAAAGGQVGMLVHRSSLNREKEDLFFSSIRALAGAVDAKDHYTKGHSERVTAYAVRLARYIGMRQEEVETVQLAAILHDVGKIGVPEGILNKPGPLTEEELALVQEHPVRGREIITTIKSPVIPLVTEGVLHHHERWDGSGYPDGIGGLDIPLVARIMALADAFDAMTTDRPYRDAYPAEYAVSLIGEAAGTQFDPELADRFIDLFYAGRLAIPTRKDHFDTTVSEKPPVKKAGRTPPPFSSKAE